MAAKVQIYFGLSKKNALFRAFFSLEDAASRYCLEARNYPNLIRG